MASGRGGRTLCVVDEGFEADDGFEDQPDGWTNVKVAGLVAVAGCVAVLLALALQSRFDGEAEPRRVIVVDVDSGGDQPEREFPRLRSVVGAGAAGCT